MRGFFSGTEVLLTMGQDPPKIIIVDILMPDFDGLQVIKNIKTNAKLKDVYIIAISGDMTKKEESIKAGANVFLKKPINLDEFRDAITKCE